MNDKFVDAGTIGYGAPTNLPEHAIRYNRSINIFEEWVAGAWIAKVIAIAGGGTGASTPADARTALGLGSMATQNSNNVNITGGSITGVNIDAAAITSGVVALARGGTGASLALGGPGTVLLSNGTQVVFDSGVNISQLNANNLTTGTVPIGRLPAGIAYLNGANVYTGTNVFAPALDAIGNYPIAYGALPAFNLYETDQAVNARVTTIAVQNGIFVVQARDDSYNFLGTLLFIARTGEMTGNGANLSNLNGANIATGIVPAARLGGGAPSATTFLRGDNTWQPVTAGGIPSGMIGMFSTACPVGWTRVAGLDNRFPLGSGSAGSVGGTTSHSHSFDQQSDPNGGHSHGFSGSGSASGNSDADSGTGGNVSGAAPINIGPVAFHGHFHTINVPVSISGSTDTVGNHDHRVRGTTDTQNFFPPYYSVVFCQKD